MGLVSDRGNGMAASVVVEPVPSDLPTTQDATKSRYCDTCRQRVALVSKHEDNINANGRQNYDVCHCQQRTVANGNVIHASDTTYCHKMSGSDSNSNHQSKDCTTVVHVELVNNNNSKVSSTAMCTDRGCVSSQLDAHRSQPACDDLPSSATKLASTRSDSDIHQSKPDTPTADHTMPTNAPHSLNPPKFKVHSATPSPIKCSSSSSGTSATSATGVTSGTDSSLLTPTTRRQRYKRKPTVTGVTVEARHVLDEFLRRSLSQNDTSPIQPKELHHLPSSETPSPVKQGVPESTDELDGIPEHPTSTYEESLEIKAASDDYILDDDQTTYSPTSDCSRSSSFKNRINVRPLTEQDVTDALAKKVTKKTKKPRARKSSASSSESDGDHSSQSRRKKSAFRKTAERLRESFRRINKKPQAHTFAEERQPTADEKQSPKKKSSIKKRFSIKSKFSFRSKSGSERSSPVVTPSEHTGHYVHKRGDDTAVQGRRTRYSASDAERFTVTRRGSPRMSDGDLEKKSRSTRSIFEAVLHQLRKKVRPKSTKEVPHPPRVEHQRSKSADAATFEGINQWGGGGSQSVEELSGSPRVIRPAAPRPPPLPPLRSGLSSDALQDLRRRQRLDGLRVCQPAGAGDDEVDFAAPPPPPPANGTTEFDGLDDDIPDGRTGEPMTNQEREVMYERVADQLAQIADNYEVLSPSPDAAEGGAQGPMTFSFEALLGSTLREKGDRLAENMTEIQPVVSAMTRHVSYNTFSQILSQHLGQEPGWQQVAMMFRLTRSAVQLVGRGTQAALSIKDMTMKYFEDQFAGWVVTQGGWESMVETDLSSEVD